ncbi:hypothetical protein F5Y04DRAFT_288835 [Hypomontagnella monticulosa]|nr:hypothetical protein F5Y04DRAFT_288835 [Hypomontagnella monticulosa]
MDTSPLPTVSGPTINSPSDLSYSSGVSPTSTRDTSPDPITATLSSRPPSPRVELNLNFDIDTAAPTTLLDSQPKMDRNPFQSVNDRRNKISTDRNTTSQAQQPQQQYPQLQTPRDNMQQLNLPLRGLASSNWRVQPAEEARLPSRGGEYMPFDSPIGYPMQHGPSNRQPSYTSPTMEPFQQQQQHPGIVYRGHAAFSDVQLDASYAYCYDRGNGQYTRLIPADMLPPLQDIPALQRGCSAMLVLQQPRGLPQSGRSSNTETVLLRNPPTTPTSPADNIQSRIDTIVASTPPTPTHLHGSLSPGGSGMGPGSTTGSIAPTSNPGPPLGSSSSGSNPAHQHHHHHHQPPQRRPKIYCDKWVHEGVCAFTQQGCKYKHEMPFDKLTQHQLGLFHGFPAWWKKHQADLSRQRDVPVSVGGSGVEEPGRLVNTERLLGGGGGRGLSSPRPSSAAAGGGSGAGAGVGDVMGVGSSPVSPGIPGWRRGGEEQKSLTPSRGVTRGVGTGVRSFITTYGSPFGPIAPPTRATTSTPAGHMADTTTSGLPQPQQSTGVSMSGGGSIPTGNPYASLESLEEDENNGDYGGNGEETEASPANSRLP